MPCPENHRVGARGLVLRYGGAGTGPGLQSGSAAPVARELEEATRSAHEAERKEGDLLDASGAMRSGFPSQTHTPQTGWSGPDRRRAPRPEAGEGIGLSIVKRLCELLDASLELASQPGAGSTFGVILPRRYDMATVDDDR